MRAVEVEDLVLNACGCLLGYGILVLMRFCSVGLHGGGKRRMPALIIWLPEESERARQGRKRKIKMRRAGYNRLFLLGKELY